MSTNNLTTEQILAKLIAFDTTSRNPNRACIDFIRDYLDGFGVRSKIVAGNGEGKACLWATIGAVAVAPTPKGVGAEQSRRQKDSGEQYGIVLAGHSDVVPVDGQNWTSDPFTLTERDGKLYARGSADMKGFIACALAFVPEFLAAKTDTCFHLAFTCDEETDMTGAMHLTDHLSAQGVKPAWIWVGEPTGLTIVNQHKGVSAYSTRITGVSGHSGQPDKGLNAISIANGFIGIIEQAAQARRDKPFAPSVFTPPYTTFNLGTINGGTAENIIAEHCEILWQVRAHPGELAKDIAAEVERQAQAALVPRFAAFAPAAGMDTFTCFDIPPFLATVDNPAETTLKRALKCHETHAVGFATEAGIFQRLGAPAIICGPGFIEQAHQPDEFVDKKQLVRCVDLLRQVLLSSCA